MSPLGDEERRAFQEEASLPEERGRAALRESLGEEIGSVWVCSKASPDDMARDVYRATGRVVDPGADDLLEGLTLDELGRLLRHMGGPEA